MEYVACIAEGAAETVIYEYPLIETIHHPAVTHTEKKTTYNVGKIEGGTSVNTIAQEASMLYEYRSEDASALEWMRQSFLRALEEAGKRVIVLKD